MNLSAHDLIHIESVNVANAPGCPAWVRVSLEQIPWAVVRRACPESPLEVPIGVRGPSRRYRFAADIARSAIREVLHPEDLVPRIQESHSKSNLPPLSVLPAVKKYLGGHVWGPAGSVGFHLATGAPAVTPGSDLDLILRYDRLPRRREAARLLSGILALAPKADILLELPEGALSLFDYVETDGPCVLRADHGPALLSRRALIAMEREIIA